MASFRSNFAAIVLGSAVLASSGLAQHGASVSLIHTVTVTVPPRVKVQVAPAQSIATVRVAGQPVPNGMSLSVTATQPWTLSIGAVSAKSHLLWSRDGRSDFSAVTSDQAIIASGEISQLPTSANVFVRPAATKVLSAEAGSSDLSIVMLTMVAQ